MKCGFCGGRGYVYYLTQDTDEGPIYTTRETCTHCNGTGRATVAPTNQESK